MVTEDSSKQAIALRRLDRPHMKRKLLRLILDGKSDQQVADAIGVNQSSIYRFRQRNEAEIAELVERFESEAADYIITQKTTRLADYEEMRTILRTATQERGAYIEEETRYGRKLRLNPAIERWQSVDQQAALEMDQLPRAGITVNNQNVVIVKQVSGAEDE